MFVSLQPTYHVRNFLAKILLLKNLQKKSQNTSLSQFRDKAKVIKKPYSRIGRYIIYEIDMKTRILQPKTLNFIATP